MDNWTEQSFVEAINKVKESAIHDKEFRALCIRDINEALKEVSGLQVPPSFKINVVENSGYHLCIQLPFPEKANGELNDNELNGV